ncbi:MAG: NAD(P)-dependent glycerol-3-phosphate dehydrogenase, partial [Calditrichia bacterium]|nr:NAD(P)-dependent glycerol-3-phosphate dehydrogenase [Calditrichia bacterium]
KIKTMLKDGVVIVNLAKGIENDTLLRMSQVINQETGVDFDKIVILSGPSHAEELSRGVPTTVVSACRDIKVAEKMQKVFSSSSFRVYASDDVIGVELGGALKNIIAVAAGICDGTGYGENTKAALITRGLVEITRLGTKMGAKAETFAGLSGMGDLIVTCMSRHSRNRHVGEKIAQGQSLETVISNMNMVAEGVKTTRSVHQLIEKLNVEMPISEKVYHVLFEGKNASDEVNKLMVRELKRE